MRKFGHFFSLSCYILIIINLAYIDLLFINKNASNVNTDVRTSSQISVSKPASASIISESSSVVCDSTCIKDMYMAIENATKSADKTIFKNETIKPLTNSIKELFIPFGSGFSSSDEWTDVPGMAVKIDSGNYKGIKNVFFEATLRIPTGNQVVYARLYNITDKHPVWFSEVSLDGGTPLLITSGAITLDTGEKVYQVQMKTELKYISYIDQARIRIVLK